MSIFTGAMANYNLGWVGSHVRAWGSLVDLQVRPCPLLFPKAVETLSGNTINLSFSV